MALECRNEGFLPSADLNSAAGFLKPSAGTRPSGGRGRKEKLCSPAAVLWWRCRPRNPV